MLSMMYADRLKSFPLESVTLLTPLNPMLMKQFTKKFSSKALLVLLEISNRKSEFRTLKKAKTTFRNRIWSRY